MTGLSILREIVHYYGRARGVGNTTLMIRGARDNERAFILVVASEVQRRDLTPLISRHAKIVTIDEIRDGRLRGWSWPMILDHYALESILSEAQGVITALEDHIVKLTIPVKAKPAKKRKPARKRKR